MFLGVIFYFFCTFPLFFTVVCHRYVTNRKEYRRILLRITTVFFFGFRKKQSLFSFCRSENISQFIIFSLLLLFLLLLLSFCRTIGFLFHCHDTVIVFHSFFSPFCRCMCISFLFQHCDPLIAAIFSLWNDIADNQLPLHFLPVQNYGFVRFGFCRPLLWSLLEV